MVIDDVKAEFIKRINEKIAMREHSTRKDKERVFGEMMIYEDSIRIMNQVCDNMAMSRN